LNKRELFALEVVAALTICCCWQSIAFPVSNSKGPWEKPQKLVSQQESELQSLTTKEGPQPSEGWSLKEGSQQNQEHEWQPSSNKEAQHIRQSCW
jgi:predicted P-loop ATPase